MRKTLLILLTLLPFISTGQIYIQAKVNGTVGGLLTPGYGLNITASGLRVDTAGIATKGYVNSVTGGGTTSSTAFIAITASAGTTVTASALNGKTVGYIIIGDDTKATGLSKPLNSGTLTMTDGSIFRAGQIVTVVYH